MGLKKIIELKNNKLKDEVINMTFEELETLMEEVKKLREEIENITIFNEQLEYNLMIDAYYPCDKVQIILKNIEDDLYLNPQDIPEILELLLEKKIAQLAEKKEIVNNLLK